MIRFSLPVTTHGHRASVEVKVFDSLTAMRTALRRQHQGQQHPAAWYKEAAAVTTKYSSAKVLPNGHAGRWKYKATIYCVRNNIGSTIISHEATHAALYFYQEQVQRTIPDIRREEILCHLVSEITGGMVNKLYELGVYE